MRMRIAHIGSPEIHKRSLCEVLRNTFTVFQTPAVVADGLGKISVGCHLEERYRLLKIGMSTLAKG
jgi:hypothetical protein